MANTIQSACRPRRGGGGKLAAYNLAPELKLSQTPKENKFPTGHAFEIILPNLIHKSKKSLQKNRGGN